jgi:hypothetical protein
MAHNITSDAQRLRTPPIDVFVSTAQLGFSFPKRERSAHFWRVSGAVGKGLVQGTDM